MCISYKVSVYKFYYKCHISTNLAIRLALVKQYQRNMQTVTSLLHLIQIENQKANLTLNDEILAIANTRSLLSSCIPHHIASGKVIPVHQ